MPSRLARLGSGLALGCCKVAVVACFHSSPLGFIALVRAGSPDPAIRPPGGFQVTRRRSGTRSARVSWTRHSAERRSPRDAPTVGGWESCGRGGRGGQETTARTSYRQRLFVEHDLGESSGSTVEVVRRAGYPWPEQMIRKKSRKVRETRRSSSQKRSEPAAHPCRGPGGQGGNEHGGSPRFQGGVEPGRAPAGSDFLGSVYLTLLTEAKIQFKPVELRNARVNFLGP